MKIKHILFGLVAVSISLTACAGNAEGYGEKKAAAVAASAAATDGNAAPGAVKVIDQAQFKTLVGNYTQGENFAFVGKRPAIIDFNAEWCGPCRRLAPIVEELAREYADRIDFYSVNVDDNTDLAVALQVQSIPMLLMCPVEGRMQAIVGLYPKEEIVKAINYTMGWQE